ncbi:hypothetical protein Drose_05705 [Dactylosporangium roseum]|uniref:Uncharacterized protein n=1 Tax=Dactylosporangium roseum TaxID=47989 RepID=A0ABY5Z6T6_9ACTN|nr:hypothetical protein [Dactylosporangium roseum]UWZ37765.1 hypothetical protein Drose_05705 [Dactylosporangium roseum]
MTDYIDVPAAAWQIRVGDRLVPDRGTVRVVVAVDHRDRSLITWPGFDRLNVDNLDPRDTVTLRCPTEPRPPWSYYAGPQPGSVLGCSCVYRLVGGTWEKAITLPECTWCNPDEED